MILSYDSIINFMFLNYSTSRNEVIGKTDNGTLIFLYGHVKARYQERIKQVKYVTKMEELDINKLMEETVKIVNKYYHKCKSRNSRKVRQVIRGKINFVVGRKKFIMDLSVLVAGSEVSYDNRHPYVIDPQYKSLVETGELMVHDTVLAVETINMTVRFADEEMTNFTEQPSIAEFNLPEKEYKVHESLFLKMVDFMLKDNDAKMTPCVRRFVTSLRIYKDRAKCNS